MMRKILEETVDALLLMVGFGLLGMIAAFGLSRVIVGVEVDYISAIAIGSGLGLGQYLVMLKKRKASKGVTR